jgi:hypothetical protein
VAPKDVYHSSQTQGLERIDPSESTHGCWVYATRDLVMSAAFLGTLGGDFTCAIGRDETTGMPFICERFEGAFDLRYGGVSGSVYVLPGETFVEGKTPWSEEVVSSNAVIPIREVRVDDAKGYLLRLVEKGRLILKLYPERIDGIPDDDEDLVRRAALWYRQYGDEILDRVERYHPHLRERVQRAIDDAG